MIHINNESLLELIIKHKHCFVCRGVLLPGEEEHIHCNGCNEKLSKETMIRDMWTGEILCHICYPKYRSGLNEAMVIKREVKKGEMLSE